MTTYKIVRSFFNRDHSSRTIKRGLTLEEAREHCRDKETSSQTCTGAKARKLTERCGSWFDGYEEE